MDNCLTSRNLTIILENLVSEIVRNVLNSVPKECSTEMAQKIGHQDCFEFKPSFTTSDWLRDFKQITSFFFLGFSLLIIKTGLGEMNIVLFTLQFCKEQN